MKRSRNLAILLVLTIIFCSCTAQEEKLKVTTDISGYENLGNEAIEEISSNNHEEKDIPLSQNQESESGNETVDGREKVLLTDEQKESLKRHFELVRKDCDGGFVFVCVDGMEIYKYTVDDSFTQENIEYEFEMAGGEWGDSMIDVFLASGDYRKCIGRTNYDSINIDDADKAISFGGMVNDNFAITEEIDYDTVLDGYLKDFNFEEGSIKIDYASDVHMSPSGGMSLVGNDGVYEDAVVSSDVRFAFFYGIYNEATVKGFEDRMSRDINSSIGYSIYFKNGEVVGIADLPSA